MSITSRERKQLYESDKFVDSHKDGILHLCPRFGKIRTSILIMQRLQTKKVLILYPLNPIESSWRQDFEKWNYSPESVTYLNFSSIKKIPKEQFDLVIIDEIHALSENEMINLAEYLKEYRPKRILGLSGSISRDTEMEIRSVLGLRISSNYSIQQGIADGVITDYRITVVQTDLDNKTKYLTFSKTSKYTITEKYKYDWYSKKIQEAKAKKKDFGLLPILRMNVIKNSKAKIDKTKQLIKALKDKRVLIFCGTTETADSLGVDVYHSKNNDKELLERFKSGQGNNHLAVIDMVTAGTTFKPIQCAIFNYFNSNSENITQRLSRLIGMEYDNPDKIADIYIVVTNTIEKEWLKKALSMLDSDKITYV